MNQEKRLLSLLEKNKNIKLILERVNKLEIPNWYLGAGGITQTVWNALHHFDLENGIKDYDLVYYDSSNISYEAEDGFIQKSKELFSDVTIPVEIINEARVHLWYKKHFGFEIEPYNSVEEAINSWPTTATSIGINYTDKNFKIYAPFGLDDLFNLTVRPNKMLITEEIYNNKINRWKKVWPKLKIIPW